ncbi:MAG: YqaA family protein [Gammaproteobacteria bacterium]|nr:YqaA family protein [Gammaproteobacteria bacterium]
MKIFSALYARVMRWSAHPHARWYLGGLSFAESSFFPIPPDVMLAPMTLARPQSAWALATLTTVASVLGGLLGYLIGYLALEAVEGLLHQAGYWQGYLRATEWFEKWGVLAVLVAGFSPIPYKVFTISAGALGMNLPLFLLASALGRGGRFFLVAGLIRLGGERMEARIRAHVDVIGWVVVLLIAIAIGWYSWSRG